MALLSNPTLLALPGSAARPPSGRPERSPPLVSFASLLSSGRRLPSLQLNALSPACQRFPLIRSAPLPALPKPTRAPPARALWGDTRPATRRKPRSKSSTVRKVVILTLVCVAAVGSCVVLIALGYSPLPEGSGVVKFAKGAKDWVVSKVVLDDRSRWMLQLRVDAAVDTFKTISGTVVLAWVQLIPLIWLHYHHQRSGFTDPAKKRQPVVQKVCFKDVEGVGAAKEELQEIVACLQGSTTYDKLGAEPPRGTLLVGPPGTGKTLLARAVAGEAGVPFFSASASEFVEVFVGRGAARVRELFKEARKHEPSIVFIDELDAVGGKRGRSFNDEHDQTLVQLLTEMDGFETGSQVIVIAATNRPETLDSALCRPGRFSRKVVVGKPDVNGRKKILAVHLRGVPLEDDVQETCDLVAGLTPGLVGADLANIVKEAVLLAARRGADAVSREDIMKGVERAKFGIVNQQLSEETSPGDEVEVQRPIAVSGLYT